MHDRIQVVIGLVICLAAAALMVTGTMGLEIGLVIGTLGMLIVGTHSSARTRRNRHGETR